MNLRMGISRNSGFIVTLAAVFVLAACIHVRAETANVNGTVLYYESAGKGQNVVLIHGGLADRRVWNDQFAKLSRNFRVVRYDLRGYGRSEFPKGEFSHIEDLRALLSFLKIDKASLVGLSIGGVIATDFTLSHPQNVEKLILVSPGLRGENSPVDPQTIEVFKAVEAGEPDQAIDLWLKNPLFSTISGNRSVERRTREMLADNYKYWSAIEPPIPVVFPEPPTIDRLAEIKTPTLVVVGDKDAPRILKSAKTLSSKIGGAELTILKNVSHHLNVEKPKRFNRLVSDFLRRKQ